MSDQGFNTNGQTWLRGYQTTDATGLATFTTIVPGWYSGRAIHIHFKVRTSPGATSDSIYNQTGGQTLLTLAPAGDGYSASIGIGIQA